MTHQILNIGLWRTEDYRQRLTTVQWRTILLNMEDKIIVRGLLRTLEAKNLGAGVYEIYKRPLEK